MKPSIKLYSGIEVDSPETLEEVLRLLESLDDMGLRPAHARLAGITNQRIREVIQKPKVEPKGRIMP